MNWKFPLKKEACSGIPQKGHPGAFLTKRKHHIHTGVDLYTNDGEPVYAVEDGIVINIEGFTGLSQHSPWWEDTYCVLIEGNSGVVCYGEIIVSATMHCSLQVSRGQLIGHVKRVLRLGKERPDIQGHSTSMLHVELYKHGVRKSFEENPALGQLSDWTDLIDPTPFLMKSDERPEILLFGT